MAQPWADRFYKTKRWQKCRNAYFNSQHGICEVCGEPGEIVHHIEPLTEDNINDPEIALGWDNLQLCCWSCHEKTKTKDGIPIREDISFDDDGNVIPTGKRIAPLSKTPGGA